MSEIIPRLGSCPVLTHVRHSARIYRRPIRTDPHVLRSLSALRALAFGFTINRGGGGVYVAITLDVVLRASRRSYATRRITCPIGPHVVSPSAEKVLSPVRETGRNPRERVANGGTILRSAKNVTKMSMRPQCVSSSYGMLRGCTGCVRDRHRSAVAE